MLSSSMSSSSTLTRSPSHPSLLLSSSSSTSSTTISADMTRAASPSRRSRSLSSSHPHHLVLSPSSTTSRKAFLSSRSSPFPRKRRGAGSGQVVRAVSVGRDSADEDDDGDAFDVRREGEEDEDEEEMDLERIEGRRRGEGEEEAMAGVVNATQEVSLNDRNVVPEFNPSAPSPSPSSPMLSPKPTSCHLPSEASLIHQEAASVCSRPQLSSFAQAPSPSPPCIEAFESPSAAPLAHHKGSFPLGQPILKVAFCAEEGEDPVPPCFYPGQTIPTTLLFELPRYTSLPHALNPVLMMSLVGTLRHPASSSSSPNGELEWEERGLINVGVSLAEGLRLWGKDAGLAWDRLSERKKRGRQDPKIGLPGGKYTLPLTVQVPTHPKLPPSFDLPSSSFTISYHLEVALTIDRASLVDPLAPPERVILVSASRGFTLLPSTLPSVTPELPGLQGLIEVPAVPAPIVVPSTHEVPTVASVLPSEGGWLGRFNPARIMHQVMSDLNEEMAPVRRLTHLLDSAVRSPSPAPPTSWSIHPSIPTSTFSPSSVIPLDLSLLTPFSSSSDDLAPPPLVGELLIKTSVLRREYVFHSTEIPRPEDEEKGLVHEEEVVKMQGKFDLASLPVGLSADGSHVEVVLPRLEVPLGYKPSSASSSASSTRFRPWREAFTTSLTISPDGPSPSGSTSSSSQGTHTHCSSRFYLSVHIAYSPNALSPSALSVPIKSRSLLIPLTIGSVGEPQGARHRRSWRELYLERDAAVQGGEERPRMINGSGIDEEGGWLVPPPSYQAALKLPEYIL